MSPAFPPACSSASLAPFTAASDCARPAPCSGYDEYTVTDFGAVVLFGASDVPGSSLPQAATPNPSTATRQPAAAVERECMKPPPDRDRSTASSPWRLAIP